MPNNATAAVVFDIAVGKSRKEINWRNKEMRWGDLVKRLADTHRTAETHAEYIAATKDRQAEIKDVGGFVGGFLVQGKRKAGSVMHRQLITLDIDYCKTDFWQEYQMLFDNAAVLYSTHKHAPGAPRLRLILLLDRSVQPDEYEAISRKIAGLLNIEVFDPTTFQAERLMYWPSTPKDGEYVFEEQQGPAICADKILATYTDWQDSSSWPVSSRVDKVMQRNITKQGDPLEKKGVVGAFCRVFSISEAINEYLQDVYDSCDVENRYTYKHGSTGAGLVVYDEKYCFSHHGTDPVSGKLCNAFDLVRLHKYGLKDEDCSASTPINKLPSYLAMLDLAAENAAVRSLLVTERYESANIAFADIDLEVLEQIENEVVINDDWKEKLDIDRKGVIYNTIDNIVLIFENDQYLKGRIAYDDFEKVEVAIKNLPWRKVTHQSRRLTDQDDANIRYYLEKAYNITAVAKIKDAMQVLCQRTSFHPVRDYLTGVRWDGVSRIDTLFTDYMGAEDSEYMQAIARKSLVACVKRVFEPGCKFDYTTVFIGEQGKKKSTLIDKLGMHWFSDSLTGMKGKDAFEQLQGVWVLELAELSAMSKYEAETVKHFLTKRKDRYRVAYGHRVEEFPRQCVPFGTTNKRDFLKDPTGNRRFWPVAINVVKPAKNVSDLTQLVIDQIWAEAYQQYKAGELVYLPEHLEEVAKSVQRQHTEEHPWVGVIYNYLKLKIPENFYLMSKYERISFLNEDETLLKANMMRTRVCILEIWEEALRMRNAIDDRSANTIRSIMDNMEPWVIEEKSKRYGVYGLHRNGYFNQFILPD